MAQRQRQRFRSVELTAPPANSRRPRAISDGDARYTPRGLANIVIGRFLRFNVVLEKAPEPWPTALAEYVIEERIIQAPNPEIIIEVNRTIIYPFASRGVDPGANVPDGDFWAYRAIIDDGNDISHIEQRIRLGHITDVPEQLRVRALFYVVDYTIGEGQ